MQLQNIKSELTFVIPVRIDCKERIENLRTILHYLERLRCNIIVLEADSSPSIEREILSENIKYIFIKDSSDVFFRTHYINDLIRRANTNIIAVWDTDVLVDYTQIYKALQQIKEGYTIAYPYNGEFVLLAEQISDKIREKVDLEYLRCMKLKSFMGRKMCGGAYLVNRQQYLLCGGENEHFISWGPEDTERMHRVQILGYKVTWTKQGQLYHLYHPRGENSKYPSEENANRLRKEFIKVCCMDKETLIKYIQE